MEVSGFLVVPAVFKTDVADSVGQAGSIPVRLRQPAADGALSGRPGAVRRLKAIHAPAHPDTLAAARNGRATPAPHE
jgi:hypothetical protein